MSKIHTWSIFYDKFLKNLKLMSELSRIFHTTKTLINKGTPTLSFSSIEKSNPNNSFCHKSLNIMDQNNKKAYQEQ